MNLLPVFNFIVHHFIQARVQNVVVFNCWDSNSQFEFLQNANDHLLRTQMVDINRDFQFPGGHMNGIITVLGVFLDFYCNKSARILKKASELQLFTAKYNWLIVDKNYNYSEMHNQLENAMMSIDAQITYTGIDKTNSNASQVSFTLYDVYNNGKFLGGKLNTTFDKQVTCTKVNCETKHLSSLHLKTKYGNRCDLNDTTFRVSTILTGMSLNSSIDDLIEFLSSMNNPHVDAISRYGFKLSLILQEMLNYKLKRTYRDTWSRNETHGGSFGDVAMGDAEISTSAFVPSVNRARLSTMILRVGDFRSLFLFRTPHNEGLYGGVFLQPFSKEVWIAFGVVILVFAFTLWAVFAIEFRIRQYLQFIPSLLSTFLISFGLACVQDAAVLPRTSGGRIAFISLSAVTFIMYNYYTSTVVSSLVGSPLKSNIKTVGQLADSSLDIGIEPIGYTAAFLNSSTSADVRKFVRNKLTGRMGKNSTLWLKAEEGVLKVKDGGFAYHSEASTAFWLIEKHYHQHELCDLNEVNLRDENTLGILLGKMSTYKEIVRISMIRMLESGVISKHRRYWMKTKLHCFSNSYLVNVGLEYTGPLFVFVGIVYISTLIVLFLEIVYHKYAIRRIA